MATAWARNLRSRMPCAAKGKRAVCLLAHDDAVDKSFLFLPGANELIPACGIRERRRRLHRS